MSIQSLILEFYKGQVISHGHFVPLPKLTSNQNYYFHVPIKHTVCLAFRAKNSLMYGTFNRVLLGFLQTVRLIGTGHFGANRMKNSKIYHR